MVYVTCSSKIASVHAFLIKKYSFYDLFAVDFYTIFWWVYAQMFYTICQKNNIEFSLNKRILHNHYALHKVKKKDEKEFIHRCIWKYDISFMEWQRYRVTSKKGDNAVICYFPAHNNQIINVKYICNWIAVASCTCKTQSFLSFRFPLYCTVIWIVE